jgi:hypothetical protein
MAAGAGHVEYRKHDESKYHDIYSRVCVCDLHTFELSTIKSLPRSLPNINLSDQGL